MADDRYSLSTKVFHTIREDILSGKYRYNEELKEKTIGDELGVSRTPVREALIELSKVKIIEIYPQRKSMVSLIDYELVEESRFMRNLLECAVAELDCEMATPQDIRRLEDNLQLQKLSLIHISEPTRH